MVIYFSGTGNSRYCAEMLAHKLGDEVLDAGGYIKNAIAAELISQRPWVFVCPVYAWKMPRIFADFIRSGNFQGNQNAYFVLTCGLDIGNAAESIEKLCQEIRLTCKGVLQVTMPENYIAMFPVPDEEESEKIVARARPVLEEGTRCIRRGADFSKVKLGITGRIKSGWINDGFYRYAISAKGFYAAEACIGCGKCAASCVLNNIEIKSGRPVWKDNCTHCMACICYCPVEAIEYGKKSRGKRRYRGPVYRCDEE